VALVCVDYKLFAKVLANILKSHLDSIVHKDQTYCVPGCSIMTCWRVSNVNFRLVSLDQEKTCDRVDHEYLSNAIHVSFGMSV
jgi:hypothetical protein